MYIPKTAYTQVACNSILHRLGIEPGTAMQKPIVIPEEFHTLRRGCFVSLHEKCGKLRGCIGTIYPQEKNLYFEISRNALSAAFNDHRFSPLTSEEFENLEVSVDVLTSPESIFSINGLDPQIFGVIVSDFNDNRAVLLPGIPGVDTIEKQISIVKRKAGICKQTSWEELDIMRFTSNRYK